MNPRNDAFIAALDPDLFSHGRLLRRFAGSDACRFSARTAVQLIEHIDISASGPHVLWDPFCGAGMIPCVALAAFPGAFERVISSDLNPDASHCALGNMQVVSDRSAFDARRDEVHRRRRTNDNMDRRGAAVESYMQRIQPLLAPARARSAALRCDAFRLPPGLPGTVHFVTDLPHGKQCELQGNVADLVGSLRAAYPTSSITLVTTTNHAEWICASVPHAIHRALSGGRVIVRIGPP